MGKFSKHIGNAEPFKIKDEEFNLKTLGIEHAPTFLMISGKAAQNLQGLKTDEEKKNGMANFIASLSELEYTKMVSLVDETLEKSFPQEDVAERKSFGLKYFMELLLHIMDINSSNDKSHENVKKMDTIKRMTNQQ